MTYDNRRAVPRQRRRFGCLTLIAVLVGLGLLGVIGVGAVIASPAVRNVFHDIVGDRVYTALRTRAESGFFQIPSLPSPARDAAHAVVSQIPGPDCDTYWVGTRWEDVGEGGESLVTSPSQCVRDAGFVALNDAWQALIAIEPRANVEGMRDQLACHLIGAPTKETWNLEPWRPAVGLRETMSNMCNPT